MNGLDRIDGARVGLIGDLALDIYWYADMKKSELSRETPHYPLPVVREVVQLGAGGNAAANIAALKPGSFACAGVCGDDWRGGLLRERAALLGADLSGLAVEPGRFTQSYCKPMRMGISDVVYEDPRIDFAALADPSAETERQMLAWLDRMDGELNVLCVCDQFAHGALTDAAVERLGRMKTTVIVDSRSRIEAYRARAGRLILKPNEDECRAALTRLGVEDPGEPEALARTLSGVTGADILLTLGGEGSLFYTARTGEVIRTPAVKVTGPVDICGAGDTTLAAFACGLAAGFTEAEAARLAAAASSVTVKKLGTTGTASREEIRAALGE